MKKDVIFFGTPEYATLALDEMEKLGITPKIVVTTPDRKAGRGMKLSPPPVKVWGEKRNIEVRQPEKLDERFINEIQKRTIPVGIVAAYGKIIPQDLIEAFPKGILNIHPSLLPKYRGASPVRSQILADDKDIGVTIMKIDAELDHGPLLARKAVTPPYWPMQGSELTDLLFREGGKLCAEILPKYMNGEIEPREQDHTQATFTKKISKGDGKIDMNDDPYQNLLKIRAFDEWPRAYFFTEGGKRVIVTEAEVVDGKLVIKKVIPEGKKEMEWVEFEKRRS